MKDDKFDEHPEEEKNQPATAQATDDSQKSAISADLIRGHINTIILRTLDERDKYGYEIMNEIEEKSHGQYSLKQPTLYSALKRLESQGYIKAYWKTDEVSSGGRRKYFTLTELGREYSEKNQAEWEYSRTVIDSLISDRSFDFSQPAPTHVDFNLLKKSVSRVYTGGGRDGGEGELMETLHEETDERSEYAKKYDEIESSPVKDEYTGQATHDLFVTRSAKPTDDEKQNQQKSENQDIAVENSETKNEEIAAGNVADAQQVAEPQIVGGEAIADVQQPAQSMQAVQTEQYAQQALQTEQTLQQAQPVQPEQYVQQTQAVQTEQPLQQPLQQPVPPVQQGQPPVQPAPQHPPMPEGYYAQNVYYGQNIYPPYPGDYPPPPPPYPYPPQPQYIDPYRGVYYAYGQPPVPESPAPEPPAPQQEPPQEQPKKRELFADRIEQPVPDEDTRTEEEKRIAHENYLKIIADQDEKERGTVPHSEDIDTEKLIYTNKPETERDYKKLVNNIFNKAIKNSSPPPAPQEPEEPEEQPQPEPVIENTPEPVSPEQPQQPRVQNVYYTSYDPAQEKARNDGLKVNTLSSSPVRTRRSRGTTYNRGAALFGCAVIVGIILLIEFAVCLAFMQPLNIGIMYPMTLLILAVVELAVFGIMYACGYGRNSVRPTSHTYISLCVVLTVISILIICLVSFLLDVNLQSGTDIAIKLVIPSITALNITIFGISFYFISK